VDQRICGFRMQPEFKIRLERWSSWNVRIRTVLPGDERLLKFKFKSFFPESRATSLQVTSSIFSICVILYPQSGQVTTYKWSQPDSVIHLGVHTLYSTMASSNQKDFKCGDSRHALNSRHSQSSFPHVTTSHVVVACSVVVPRCGCLAPSIDYFAY